VENEISIILQLKAINTISPLALSGFNLISLPTYFDVFSQTAQQYPKLTKQIIYLPKLSSAIL